PTASLPRRLPLQQGAFGRRPSLLDELIAQHLPQFAAAGEAPRIEQQVEHIVEWKLERRRGFPIDDARRRGRRVEQEVAQPKVTVDPGGWESARGQSAMQLVAQTL